MAQVEDLRATFGTYDPERTGRIRARQLRRLLLEQCPHAEKSQADLKKSFKKRAFKLSDRRNPA